jgi:hypothetical protein
LAGAIDPRFSARPKQREFQSIAQPAHPFAVFTEACRSHFGGLAHPDNTCGIFRAGSAVSFLVAADE